MSSQGAAQQKSQRPQRSQGRFSTGDFKDQNGYGNGVDPQTNGEVGPPPRVDITKLKVSFSLHFSNLMSDIRLLTSLFFPFFADACA